MSDFNSSLPVRTQNNGDVVAFIADGLTSSQLLNVDAAGKITVKLDDAAGNGLTSQASGGQRALDVGIDVAGVQIDPRQIRVLTSADVVTVDQGTSPWAVSGTVSATQGTSPWVENLSQVGGQSIDLGQEAGVSSVPVVIASDQSDIPVNLHDGSGNAITSTGGSLNVNVTSSAASNPLVKFNETDSLAQSSTAVHEVVPSAFPFFMTGAWASASGKIKAEIWVSTAGLTTASSVRSAGGAVEYLVGFNSTANPNIDKDFSDGIKVLSGSSVYALLTNDDNASMNVYSTISGHS